MKKKIFLILTMIAIFALTLALGVSAATYKYYENEIADENLLYTAETMVAKDFNKNQEQTRYEAIREDSGIGFAKYDAEGNALSWYVVSEEVLYDDSGNYLGKNVVVKSALTIGGVGTMDENGLYTVGQGTVSGITSLSLVSANFFGTGVKSFPDEMFKTNVSDDDRKVVGTYFTGNWSGDYSCVAAPGSYLAFLYLPDTLEAIPTKFCYRSPLRVLEFENNVSLYTTLPRDAFQFCASLKILTIPEGITTLPDYVKVKENGVEVEYATFRECLSLEFVKLPDSLTVVPENVFYRCVSIKTVVYGENVTYIGRLSKAYGRFGFGTAKTDNVNLKYIYVPNSISATSYFSEYMGVQGSSENYVYKVNNVVFFFDGTLEEAKLVGSQYTAEDSHFNIALGQFAHDTIKMACDPIDYATYNLNREYYDNLDGYLVVYNGDYCDKCTDSNAIGRVYSEYHNGFMQAGRKGYACPGCGFMKEVTSEIAPLFVSVGYSKSEVNYDAIMVGFEVNREAINDYKEVEGYDLSYGLFVAKSAKLGDNYIFDENGNLNTGANAVEMSNQRPYSVIELKVTGIDTFKKRGEALVMGSYVAISDGESTEYVYLQAYEATDGKKYSTVRLLDYLTSEQAGAFEIDQKEDSVDFVIDADALFG